MQTSTEINKEEIFKENSLKNLYNNFKNKSNDIVHNHNSLIIIFSFILTIYPIFFNDKANIVYETTKELKNKSKETYLIKVKNNGDINLRDIDFDSNFPWGIEVINGKFLNKDFLVYSESTYMSNKNKINLINEHQIEFTKLFFDVDDSFSFKVDVLKDRNKDVYFKSIGKVSGIKIIEIDPFILTDKIISSIIMISKFIFYILIFAIGPYVLKDLIRIIYRIIFIERKAKKIFNINKNKFDGFLNYQLFLFLFNFFSSDLKIIKNLILTKSDIIDYHEYLNKKEKEETKKSFYNLEEAEHHIKKGSGTEDEVKIYLINEIYTYMKNYLDFTTGNLVIKNEDYIIKYIDIILENKNPKDIKNVNSFIFLMD